MRINTALILCAGFGKRLNPITLEVPKPLVKLKNVSVLETCIQLIENLGIQNIIINTFYLSEHINDFIKNHNFKSKIQVISDGNDILDTGGGILNMLNHSKDENVLIFNPDTMWEKNYSEEIISMEDLYFSRKAKNMLLLVNKKLSFDKNLKGDFNLNDNLVSKTMNRDLIYTGCQILNRNLFHDYKIENFSITRVWDELIKKNKLFGFESKNDFFHLTDHQTFKKLQDL